MERATALIVSDLPIVARAAENILRATHTVARQTWREYLSRPRNGMAILVVDVTEVGRGTGLRLLRDVAAGTVVVVSTLHRNEIEVLVMDGSVARSQTVLPSLLALPTLSGIQV